MVRRLYESNSDVSEIKKEFTKFAKRILGWDINNPDVVQYCWAVAEQLSNDPDYPNHYDFGDWYRDTKQNYPEEIEEFDLHRWLGDYEESVKSYFKKKGWDVTDPDVLNYISAVAEQLLREEKYTGEYYSLDDWYADTKSNYPEDIEWLNTTKNKV